MEPASCTQKEDKLVMDDVAGVAVEAGLDSTLESSKIPPNSVRYDLAPYLERLPRIRVKTDAR